MLRCCDVTVFLLRHGNKVTWQLKTKITFLSNSQYKINHAGSTCRIWGSVSDNFQNKVQYISFIYKILAIFTFSIQFHLLKKRWLSFLSVCSQCKRFLYVSKAGTLPRIFCAYPHTFQFQIVLALQRYFLYLEVSNQARAMSGPQYDAGNSGFLFIYLGQIQVQVHSSQDHCARKCLSALLPVL